MTYDCYFCLPLCGQFPTTTGLLIMSILPAAFYNHCLPRECTYNACTICHVINYIWHMGSQNYELLWLKCPLYIYIGFRIHVKNQILNCKLEISQVHYETKLRQILIFEYSICVLFTYIILHYVSLCWLNWISFIKGK